MLPFPGSTHLGVDRLHIIPLTWEITMSKRGWTPDPAEVELFIDDLKEVVLHDGDPSLQEIARRTKNLKCDVSAATFSRMFGGTVLPKWDHVEVLLRVCGIEQEEIKSYWKPRWVVLKGGPSAAVRPGAEPSGHGSHVCPTCKAVAPPTTAQRPTLAVVSA